MKAIITTLLLLGTSTAALADSPTYDQSYQRYDSDRRFDDDRYDGRFDDHNDGRFDRRMWFRRPVLLAQNVSLHRQQWNHQQRPQLVQLDARSRGVTKLRLDRTEGRMHISAIVLNYADGHQRTLRVNQMLSGQQPSITIDLDHAGATSMYVYGSSMRGRGGSFDVIGLRR
jgi:hypothetical protein